MGAHRHRIIRQRSSRRRGSSKFSDSASSVGDDESCSTSGSAADAFSGPNGKDGGLTPGTLMRHPSVSSSSGGSGKGGEDCGRAGATNEGGDDGVPPLHGVPGYHPDAGRSERIGFAGRLSSSHEAALGGLRQWLTRERVDLTPLLGDGNSGCPPEEEDLALLRFLRCNSWDVEPTRAQLEASLSWRVETGVAASRRREPWEVSGCASVGDFEQLCGTYYPHYALGTDRIGRPVLVHQYGNFDTSKLQECTTLPGLLRYHAWEQEKNAELLRRATAMTGFLVETYTVIMDFEGMSMAQVNRDFLWLLRELSEIDRKHYPGRGGLIYVINTPPLFGLVWQGIRGFLSTQARVHFFGKAKEWKPALVEAIDPTILPPEYGGTAAPLAKTPFLPAVHRALELTVEDKGAAVPGDKAGDILETGGEQDATAKSLSSILKHFSPGGGSGGCLSDRGDGLSLGDAGGGGGSPVVVCHDFDGGGGGSETGGLARSAGGGGVAGSASANGKTYGGSCAGSGGGGGGVAWKGLPTEAGLRSRANQVAGTPRAKNGSAPPSQEHTRRDAPSGDAAPALLRSVALRAPPSERAASVLALPASDDPRIASSSTTTSSSASHVVTLRQQQTGVVLSSSTDAEEVEEDSRGDLEWFLDVVPGARLAAAVAGTVAGATLGTALGAAGFAAGVAEAVVPDQVWAEGVQAFQSAQFMGGWALGR